MADATPRTFAEKILAARAGRPVVAGDVVAVDPDIVLTREDTADLAVALTARGGGRVCDPQAHVVVLDRCCDAADAELAGRQRAIRGWLETQGIDNFFDVGAGIAHQVLPEQGFVLPGRLIVGTDPRTTTAGAFGAYATAVERPAMVDAMAGGQLSLRVPATLRVLATGHFPAGATATDLGLRVLAELGFRGAAGLALEFAGPAVAALSVSGRMALCSLGTWLGAAAAYVEPDKATMDYLNGRARDNFEVVRGDPEAAVDVREVPASGLEPMIAGPDAREAAIGTVAARAGRAVNQVLIGGCTNGRLDGLRAAAAVLRGRRASPGVRLLVLPASAEVLRAAAADGTLVALLDAGAVLLSPGCSACVGYHPAALAPDETALTTVGRFPAAGGVERGAAGAGADAGGAAGEAAGKAATVYFASPLTAAASAATGRITDPRELLDEIELRRALAAPEG